MLEVVKQRVIKAKVYHEWTKIAYQCETQKGLTVHTDEKAKTIRVKHEALGYPKHGKTGVIPCLNGFTAEVRLI